VILVTAAAYFAATFLGQQMKLRILVDKLLIISQRFFRHSALPILRSGRWNSANSHALDPQSTAAAARQPTT
jgi:hypothetical protein